MKLVTFVLLIFIGKFHVNSHLIAWDREISAFVNVSVESSLDHHRRWECLLEDLTTSCPKTSVKYERHNALTNVTFYVDGIFHMTSSSRHNRQNETITFQVVIDRDLPLNLLARTSFNRFTDLHYSYLHLSNNFLKSSSYLPKVASYFRNLMKQTSETMDRIGAYVLAKQITTKALDGMHPPEYIEGFFNHGFAGVDVSVYDGIEDLEGAFQRAFNVEKDIVRSLTIISQKAELIDDHEIEEFVVADLIPPILKRLKEFMNHIRTIRGITSGVGNKKLGEFLFDREFS